jgi:hypothetical protein
VRSFGISHRSDQRAPHFLRASKGDFESKKYSAQASRGNGGQKFTKFMATPALWHRWLGHEATGGRGRKIGIHKRSASEGSQ